MGLQNQSLFINEMAWQNAGLPLGTNVYELSFAPGVFHLYLHHCSRNIVDENELSPK